MDTAKWVIKAREDFPALKNQRNGKLPIYLDSACTALVPQPVIDSIYEYYTKYPGCAGARSRHWFSHEIDQRIEGDAEEGIKGSRTIVKEFLNAGAEREIVFTQNTSHAINTVALGFPFKQGDTVLVTDREHNSNLLPWLRLQKKGTIKLEVIPTGPHEAFNMEVLKQKLENNKVALVSMAYTSNISGYTIPAEEIIKMAHGYGARVLLDAAQTAAHHRIDVRALGTDFLALSLHKICGPRGIGVLYGKQELMGSVEDDNESACLMPAVLGGGTVSDSTYESYTLLDPPERFEVGIQNYPGQIAAGVALEYINRIGFDKISQQVTTLNKYLTGELLKRYGGDGWFNIIGPAEAEKRGGILTFEIRRPNAVGIADELNERANVMIRDGVFCVHSYFNYRFGQGWLRPRQPSEHRMIYRASLYFYNTLEECDVFLDTLHQIFEERSYI